MSWLIKFTMTNNKTHILQYIPRLFFALLFIVRMILLFIVLLLVNMVIILFVTVSCTFRYSNCFNPFGGDVYWYQKSAFMDYIENKHMGVFYRTPWDILIGKTHTKHLED